MSQKDVVIGQWTNFNNLLAKIYEDLDDIRRDKEDKKAFDIGVSSHQFKSQKLTQNYDIELKNELRTIFSQSNRNDNQLTFGSKLNLSDAETDFMIDNCQISFVEKNILLIKQGDEGNQFFMLLDGNLSVHKQELMITFNEDFKKFSGLEIGQEIEDRTILGPIVNNIENKGMIFGELGIENSEYNLEKLSEDKLRPNKRQASILTNSLSCVAIFSRSAYNNAFKRAKQKDTKLKQNLLKKSWLFRDITTNITDKIVDCMKRLRFECYSYIIKQDNNYRGIFIISSGSASIYFQDPENKNIDSNTYKAKHNSKKIDRMILKEGDLFGEVEFSASFSKYIVTVRADTAVECIVIDTENLENVLFKFYPEIRLNIKERTQVHILNMINRFGKLPIFTIILQRILDNTQEENRQMRKLKRQKGFQSRSYNGVSSSSNSKTSMILNTSDQYMNHYTDFDSSSNLNNSNNLILSNIKRNKQIYSAIAHRNNVEKIRLLEVYNSIGDARLSELEVTINDWMREIREQNRDIDQNLYDNFKIYPNSAKRTEKLSSDLKIVRFKRLNMKSLPFIEDVKFHKKLLMDLNLIEDDI